MRRRIVIVILVLCTLTATVIAVAQSPARVTTASPVVKQPVIDLVFCVDTTGSMSDEIDVVKDRMQDMIAKIADGVPVPKVRVGIVAYRDKGDEYVTRRTPLTSDLDAAVKAVVALQAGGGGDKEESVSEALYVAVNEMNWNRTPGITRLIYLIGDAGPQKYPDSPDPEAIRKKALRDGIVINAIGCSGITDKEVAFFKEMSQGSEGMFAFLTYRQEYTTADGGRKIMLKEGADTYAYEADSVVASRPMGPAGPAGPAAPSAPDWRDGAESAAKFGAARKATPEEMDLSRIVGGYSGGVARTVDGWQVNSALMNNLDVVMTRQAQTLASKQQGIKYASADLVPLLRELQGQETGLKKQVLVVIKDEKDWKKFWSDHQMLRKDPEPLPKVDFAREMVLVAVLPKIQNSGIVIREVTMKDGKMVVNYAAGTDRKAYPSLHHFAVVEKISAPVVWSKSK